MSAKSHLFTRPDINLDMSLLDYINPFNKVMGTVDKAVDKLVLDKDQALQLKTEIQKAGIEAQTQIESSYQIALKSRTIPWIDGLHKMGRQISNWLVLVATYRITTEILQSGEAITMEHVALAGAIGGPTALYTLIKGKGKV